MTESDRQIVMIAGQRWNRSHVAECSLIAGQQPYWVFHTIRPGSKRSESRLVTGRDCPRRAGRLDQYRCRRTLGGSVVDMFGTIDAAVHCAARTDPFKLFGRQDPSVAEYLGT